METSKMAGRISDGSDKLEVSMTIEIDGKQVALNKKEYKIDWVQDLGKVVVWPNFMSSKWNKYYLYSEYTYLAHEQFVPFFLDLSAGDKFIRNRAGAFFTPDDAKNNAVLSPVDINDLVVYPTGCSEDKPKYNVWGSNKPFGGLIVSTKENGKEKNAGFLIARLDKIKDLSNVAMQQKADIGIDFGSNNTCVFYKTQNSAPQPIEFLNFRAVYVGKENRDPYSKANADELFFFTNYELHNGQFKSWLHEHDSQFIGAKSGSIIAGGVPVSKPNVHVVDMNEYYITTQCGKLNYNMKWLNDDAGQLKKGAFLKSLWLQVCAYLYVNRKEPDRLYWSYPGAMMPSDINNLGKHFEALVKPDNMPITNVNVDLQEENTEAEAVCKYALGQDFGLSNNDIFLGIDVGGSTSDILLIAKSPKNDYKQSLLNESSVRLAAGVFFGAVKNSNEFRSALVNYHESGVAKHIQVANIREVLERPDKAPYFLNCIFDQLLPEDYGNFYDAIANSSKSVFAIPAYVTGLLLFYSGMLVGDAVKKNELDNINQVSIMAFGKGGRLFHWLSAISNRSMKKYYADCLNAGAEIILGRTFEVVYQDSIQDKCKTEVASGLCSKEDFVPAPADVLKSDICGEKGVRYNSNEGAVSFDTDSNLEANHFEELHKLDFTSTENFEKFVSLFLNYVGNETDIYRGNKRDIENELGSLKSNIANFIKRDDEYKKAVQDKSSGSEFSFHQPIIIAEGAEFLRSIIGNLLK